MSNVVQLPERYSYLYIMASGGYGKVGISKDPHKRLKQLKTGSPHPIKIAFMCRFNKDPYALEQDVHAILHRHHSHLEWFYLQDTDTTIIINLITNFAWIKHEMVVLDVYSDYYAFCSPEGFKSTDKYLGSGFPHMVSQQLYEETFPNGEDTA